MVGCNVAGTVGCAVGTAVGNKNCRKKRSTDVQVCPLSTHLVL